MKTYTVNVTDEVVADIRHAFNYIYERSPQNAIAWIRDLYKSIDTLETMPERCPLIREHEAFDDEIRNLIFHSHRIIFSVNEAASTVEVHTFRHAARDDIEPE